MEKVKASDKVCFPDKNWWDLNKISWEDVTNILNEYLRPDIPRGTQCAHTFIFGQRDGYCSD